MPALTVYGRFWHLASDDVPLFAAFGAIFHFAWVIAICVSGKDILTLPLHCHHSGKQYIAFYSGMLLVFFLGLLLEVLLIYEGFQGAVFQISKRRRMPFYLTLRFFNLISELVFTAYGTYVVFGTRLRCRISDTVILDPKRETMILIILTWSFELLTVLNAALWYNFWPDNDAAERWENRFAWIGRYVCCHFRPYTNEKEKDNRAYQQSLRKIARWVHKILGKLDLTPSDSALALVLVNALQRMARREKIVKSLSSADERYGLNAVSLMQRANTIGTLPMKNAGSVNIPIAISSSRMSEADVVEVSPPEGGSPVKVKTELLAGLLDEGMSDSQAEEQVNLFEKAIKKTISENRGALDDQEVKRLSLELESSVAIKRQAENFVRSVSKALTVPSSCSKSEEGEDEILKPLIGQERTNQHEDGVTSTSGSWPLENFKRQMRTLQRSCLTPSGMDQNLRGFRTSEEAVQIYTGSHWKVPAGLLQEVSYFARYAVGVYGFDAEVLKPRQKLWHWLCKCCMKIKEKTDPDEQQRTKMKMLYDDLFTGARQEMENMSELLYVSVENQALSHLPYIIALDHRSKSVVVAIRGTWSMEDIITDSVASAECLKDWLPPEFRKEHGEESEQMWAHSGVRGVADGILMDLEANGILSTLLGDKTGDLSNPEHQAASRVANGGKTSSTSKAREAAGHFIAGLMNRKLDLSGWKLVITGHSLGGGAAALIALKLCGRFKGLRCWSFCPPGGLMSKNLSRAVEPFVTSIAVGKDVVPRLSVVNIGRLIDQMVCALALCKHNKNAMLLKKMTSVWRHERASELFWDYDEVPQEALDVLQEYADIIKARSTMIELIPPGQVILLRALKVNGERNHWDAIWVKAEELIREGILISPSMANDHYALTLQAALSGAQGFVDEESVFPIYCPPRLDEEDPVPTSSLAS